MRGQQRRSELDLELVVGLVVGELVLVVAVLEPVPVEEFVLLGLEQESKQLAVGVAVLVAELAQLVVVEPQVIVVLGAIQG